MESLRRNYECYPSKFGHLRKPQLKPSADIFHRRLGITKHSKIHRFLGSSLPQVRGAWHRSWCRSCFRTLSKPWWRLQIEPWNAVCDRDCTRSSLVGCLSGCSWWWSQDGMGNWYFWYSWNRGECCAFIRHMLVAFFFWYECWRLYTLQSVQEYVVYWFNAWSFFGRWQNHVEKLCTSSHQILWAALFRPSFFRRQLNELSLPRYRLSLASPQSLRLGCMLGQKDFEEAMGVESFTSFCLENQGKSPEKSMIISKGFKMFVFQGIIFLRTWLFVFKGCNNVGFFLGVNWRWLKYHGLEASFESFMLEFVGYAPLKAGEMLDLRGGILHGPWRVLKV